MAPKSSETSYGSVAVTIHWLSAILIIVVLGTGFRAGSLTDPGAKVDVLRVHASLAIVVILLTLARIVWWWFADRRPDPVAGLPRWQHISARVVHILFYVVILSMGASGIGMLVLSGAGPVVFGGEGQLPDFWNFLPRVPHGIGARLMVALLVVHASAALYHQYIRRDGTLRRMWYRSA